MRLINIEAFLEREQVMSDGGGVNWQTEVLDSTYDKATSYAILSHRWTEQEVNYEEIVDLAKMGKKDQIRQRLGYQKILASCVQAKKDKFEQLWVDMCCIDKRSSAELSEAINSMYQWYENAGVCYVYLHDIPNPWFPTACDKERYHDFRGWPEWFSHGWTLQELIAPSGVQFFSKNWQNIGNKRMLAPTLAGITGIPGLWKAGHLRSGILSAEWRLAVVRCANPFLDRSFSKGHLTPPSFITLSYSRMSRPSYSRKSRRPYITPSYSRMSHCRTVESHVIHTSHHHTAESHVIRTSHRRTAESHVVCTSHHCTAESHVVRTSHRRTVEIRVIHTSHCHTVGRHYITSSCS